MRSEPSNLPKLETTLYSFDHPVWDTRVLLMKYRVRSYCEVITSVYHMTSSLSSSEARLITRTTQCGTSKGTPWKQSGLGEMIHVGE